jgi:hypothetical protein
MKPTEQLERTLERLLQWISSADGKVAPILAITTSMLGFIAAWAPRSEQWTIGIVFLFLLALVPLFISLVSLFFVTFPRTEGPEGSLIYFEGIKKRKKGEYIKEALARQESAYSTDLAEQCHRNAEIASAKFTALRVAMFTLFFAIAPWLILVWRLYQLKQ